MTPTIEIAGTATCTRAEGPHARFAVWVQGCSLGCPGCCNPEMFVRGRGQTIEIAALAATIAAARASAGIEGVTILGGEPLQQLEAVTALCEAAAARSLGVIVFSGYTHTQARALPGFDRLWSVVDTLVDGRFDARRRDGTRRFVGSANQRLVHRTGRYADPSLWRGAATVELDVGADGSVRLVGEPDLVGRVLRRLPLGTG